MRVDHDILSKTDLAILGELARRIEPHIDEVVAEWAQAWAQAVPIAGADPAAYRQMITYSLAHTLRTTFGYLAAGDVQACYEYQYTTNREYAHSQVPAGVMPLFSQRDMAVVSRLGHPIVTRWITRLFADDHERTLRVLLAQERFGGQMAAVLGESYSDEREARLRSISERLRLALGESEQLRQLGQTIAQSLDPDPVLDLTLQTALQFLRADGAVLTLAEDDNGVLQVHRVRGGDRAAVGQRLPVDDPLHGRAYRENRPITAPPAEAMSFDADGIEQSTWRLAVPLRVAGKSIGTLAVTNQMERNFSRRDERLLQGLADSVATALENARVHGAVRAALAEAERADRSKSEFIAAVAHEVRSPLTALIGYVELLRTGSFGELTSQQQEIVERVEVVAQSAVRLTNDLVDHARLEAGMLPVRLETVPLRPVFDELANMAQGLLGERPVTLTVAVHPGADAVHADPLRLRQVLSNLLSNAVKFTHEGGITLSAATTTGGRVELSVQDTGSGIPADDLPHIFDLFYRAENSAAVAGAGIGLFLSRQLAQLMGGALTVESQFGHGARFTVTLAVATI